MLLETSKKMGRKKFKQPRHDLEHIFRHLPSGKLRTGWNPGSKSATRSVVGKVSGRSRGAVGSARPVHNAQGGSGGWHPHLSVLGKDFN